MRLRGKRREAGAQSQRTPEHISSKRRSRVCGPTPPSGPLASPSVHVTRWPIMGRKPIDARCSFCGKSRDKVQRLVAGPGVFICDACVALCNEIIQEQPPGTAVGDPKPQWGPETIPPAGFPPVFRASPFFFFLLRPARPTPPPP